MKYPEVVDIINIDGEAYVVISREDDHAKVVRLSGDVKVVWRTSIMPHKGSDKLFYYSGTN